jgi:hypothetical protein
VLRALVPALDRPDLIIEVSHAYLASVLLRADRDVRRRVAARAKRGRRARRRASHGGLGVALGFSAALLGAVTVKLGNAPFATLAHWTVAMSVVATTVATLIRAGGWRRDARLGGVSHRTKRGALAGAVMALLAVVMGGLTAKYPGAAVACQDSRCAAATPTCSRRRCTCSSRIACSRSSSCCISGLASGSSGAARRSSRGAPSPSRSRSACCSSSSPRRWCSDSFPGAAVAARGDGVSIWIATFTLAYLRASPAAAPRRRHCHRDGARRGSVCTADQSGRSARRIRNRTALTHRSRMTELARRQQAPELRARPRRAHQAAHHLAAARDDHRADVRRGRSELAARARRCSSAAI